MKIEFKEKQKFTQWWLWLILIGVGLILTVKAYRQLFFGEQFGNKPMSDFGLIILTMAFFGFMILFWIMQLRTEVSLSGIRIEFFPFVSKAIERSQIVTAQSIDYGFIGYGIRKSRRYGTVYNVRGNKGLLIKLKNGNKILIGTQKIAELDRVIKKIVT